MSGPFAIARGPSKRVLLYISLIGRIESAKAPPLLRISLIAIPTYCYEEILLFFNTCRTMRYGGLCTQTVHILTGAKLVTGSSHLSQAAAPEDSAYWAPDNDR